MREMKERGVRKKVKKEMREGMMERAKKQTRKGAMC
jgi:hypothetical protein